MFARYVIVQVLAYGIDMGIFLLLMSTESIEILSANVVGKLAAGVFAYFCHRKLTFKMRGPEDRMKQAIRYFALLLVNIPTSALVLYLVLHAVSISTLAKFIADVVLLLATYLITKKFVFSRSVGERNGT